MGNIGFYIFIFSIISKFLHLGSRVPLLGLIRIDLLLAVALLGMVLADQKRGAYNDHISNNLKFFIGYLVLTVPFVEWPGSVVHNGALTFFKAVIYFYLTVHFIKTEKQLKIFLYTFLLVQAFRCVEPLWLHITTGYWGSKTYIGGGQFAARLGGAPHDIVNPNGLAFVITTAFIFHHFLSKGQRFKYRLVYFASIPLYLYAMVLTESRSGLLAIAISVGGIIWQSKKRFLMLSVCLLVGAIGFTQLSPQHRDRYYSIFGGSGVERKTALGRWEGTKVALMSFLERPVVGHGLGTSAETGYHTYGAAAPAHNLLAEILQETGLVGLALFLRFLYAINKSVVGTIKALRQEKRSILLANAISAIGVYFYMNLLFCLFSYGLSKYTWYLCAGLVKVVSQMSEIDQQHNVVEKRSTK